ERLADGDLEQVQRLAHTLKGSAGSLGAMRVSVAAEALQAAIRHEAGLLYAALGAAAADILRRIAVFDHEGALEALRGRAGEP
ncbi:MAG: Hpt domain-containing protein, partial [Rhodocyclaceae bacterium]|nr:Hpt domain-containing protein [Rhodocyclaceae bacterium]